jgi:hypothetical protein
MCMMLLLHSSHPSIPHIIICHRVQPVVRVPCNLALHGLESGEPCRSSFKSKPVPISAIALWSCLPISLDHCTINYRYYYYYEWPLCVLHCTVLHCTVLHCTPACCIAYSHYQCNRIVYPTLDRLACVLLQGPTIDIDS